MRCFIQGSKFLLTLFRSILNVSDGEAVRRLIRVIYEELATPT
jgi:hypothetical protein